MMICIEGSYLKFKLGLTFQKGFNTKTLSYRLADNYISFTLVISPLVDSITIYAPHSSTGVGALGSDEVRKCIGDRVDRRGA